jgi:iron complex transport system substrate-binding protein
MTVGGGPARIVSLVPSTTESVCELGAASRLVGCTRYCTEPAAALRGVERIGGTKNPDRDAVLRLRPDLILGNAEENRPEDLDWLAARAPVLVQTPRDVPSATAALDELAARLDATAAAAPIVASVRAWTAAMALGTAPGPRVLYVIWRKPWMSVNGDTFVHDVLARCGATNVCAAAERRYPEVDPAVLAAGELDLVLLASEPWEFDASQRDELATARTFGAARLMLCDGRDFCWHGTRMARGLSRARAALAAR